SHMVQQVLQHFGFTYSSPQSTPLPTGHSLSAPPSDETVEPSDPYPELVGCLITSGMGLVLGGRARVILTGHADAFWVDDLATQRSSQGYTFSLGSVSVSWRSTRSSSVLSSSCEAEIYAGAMAAQELRWLTYLLSDLGEAPRSPPVLYIDNKAMLALCQEHRQEHRTKHIALRYFLARDLQQRGQLHLAYVASQANTADVFTKALQPCDHQRFCTVLGLGEERRRGVVQKERDWNRSKVGARSTVGASNTFKKKYSCFSCDGFCSIVPFHFPISSIPYRHSCLPSFPLHPLVQSASPHYSLACTVPPHLSVPPLTHRRILTGRFALVGLNTHELVNVKVSLSLRLFLPSPSENVLCSLHDLQLVRSEIPYLQFGFLLRHIVNDASPLHGLSLSDLLVADASFSLTISGLERASMQPVFVVKEYLAYDGEVLWDDEFLHLSTLSSPTQPFFLLPQPLSTPVRCMLPTAVPYRSTTPTMASMAARISLILLAALMACAAHAATAAKISQMYVFGDESADVGNANYFKQAAVKANKLPYGVNFKPASGRFSDGKLVVDYLGTTLSEAVAPVFCFFVQNCHVQSFPDGKLVVDYLVLFKHFQPGFFSSPPLSCLPTADFLAIPSPRADLAPRNASLPFSGLDFAMAAAGAKSGTNGGKVTTSFSTGLPHRISTVIRNLKIVNPRHRESHSSYTLLAFPSVSFSISFPISFPFSLLLSVSVSFLVFIPSEPLPFHFLAPQKLDEALFVMSIGANDYIPELSRAQPNMTTLVALASSVSNIVINITQSLYNLTGSSNILIVDLPNLGCAPVVRRAAKTGINCTDAGNQVTIIHNYALLTKTDKLRNNPALPMPKLLLFRQSQVFKSMIQVPASGLTNQTHPCCGAVTSTGVVVACAQTIGNGKTAVTGGACVAPGKAVWWDDHNPTQAVNQKVANTLFFSTNPAMVRPNGLRKFYAL
ncbi:unnamed protein product, partial [Closterium sp. NIES-54]